jgi:heme-degrading monooxygenase HmoA
MADDPEEYEEPLDDDPFAVFDEWASEADQRAWAGPNGR